MKNKEDESIFTEIRTPAYEKEEEKILKDMKKSDKKASQSRGALGSHYYGRGYEEHR